VSDSALVNPHFLEESLTIGDLRTLLAALTPQPIETAPKDGTRILMWWPSKTHIPQPFIGLWSDAGQSQHDGWTDDELGVYQEQGDPGPTHWQSLPEGPTGERAVSFEQYCKWVQQHCGLPPLQSGDVAYLRHLYDAHVSATHAYVRMRDRYQLPAEDRAP
jgi:hypothetical protein